METRESKSQVEVWEWKESLYKELRHVRKDKRLKFIKEKVRRTIDKLFSTPHTA